VLLKAGLEAENDVAMFWRGSFRRGDLGVGGFRFETAGQDALHGPRDYANSRGAADMGVLPDRLPGYAYVGIRMRTNPLKGCGPAGRFRQSQG